MCLFQIGGEVQYGITDVVVMVREVADHQDILRLAIIIGRRTLRVDHLSKYGSIRLQFGLLDTI